MARVLIIDDDAAFLATLQATLRSLGHTVIAVDNGAEGLARLSEGGLDLAFVDFRMPGMTGIEVLRASGRCAIAAGATGDADRLCLQWQHHRSDDAGCVRSSGQAGGARRYRRCGRACIGEPRRYPGRYDWRRTA